MLSRLRVQNFAIIEELELDLPKGFIAITGETGAGKSILFDAISLCLGGRASTDMIRHGNDKAVVELEVDLSAEQRLQFADFFDELDCEVEEILVIKRILAENGRNRIYLNGVRVPLSALTQLSKGLVDIIGQHASHELLSVESHIGILDNFTGVGKEVQEMIKLVEQLRQLQNEVRTLQSQEDVRQLKIHRLQKQLDDIDMADVKIGEDERLAKEIDRLLNAEQMRENTTEVSYRLSGGDGSVVDQLSASIQTLQRIAHLDEDFENMLDVLSRARIELEEVARDVHNMSESVTVSQDEIDMMQERLDLLIRLKKTHGGDLASVLKAKDILQQELDALMAQCSRIHKAIEERKALEVVCIEKSVRLSHQRQEAAVRMEKLVEDELKQLGMPHCRFRVQFQFQGDSGLVDQVEDATVVGLSATGLDKVEYLISPNPGEGFQSMAKIASGGELSRILLALKVALIQTDPVGAYIFDEVDTGIGGGIAQTVGQKLQQIGNSRQVLCISHLPQVISCAHHHLQVCKQVIDDRTSSKVDVLNFEERVNEVARMLGGMEITQRTKEHALEMLRSSQPKITHLNYQNA